jgi:hypothetical protein
MTLVRFNHCPGFSLHSHCTEIPTVALKARTKFARSATFPADTPSKEIRAPALGLRIVLLGNDSPLDNLPEKLSAIRRDRGFFADARGEHTDDTETTKRFPERRTSYIKVLAQFLLRWKTLTWFKIITRDQSQYLLHDFASDGCPGNGSDFSRKFGMSGVSSACDYCTVANFLNRRSYPRNQGTYFPEYDPARQQRGDDAFNRLNAHGGMQSNKKHSNCR